MSRLDPRLAAAFFSPPGSAGLAAELTGEPVPYTLTPQAEEELDAAAEAEPGWDSAGPAACQARVEPGLEPGAGL